VISTSLGFDVSNVEVMSWITPQSFSTNANCELSEYNVCANDVWGYVSPSGREYAILGLYSGTGFVDVTDPRNPVIVGAVSDADSDWSDVRTYQSYAYNCNENGGGIQVIDLSQIDPPARQVSLVRSVRENGLSRSHTLALNAESGYLYLCASNLANGRLVALSLADPSNPAIAGQMIDSRYVHAAQVVTYHSGPYAGREIAFCFSGSQGLWIVDVTDKSNMFTMSTFMYPNATFCHQGWLTADRRHVLLGDELDEIELPNVNTSTTYVINVENLSNPHFVSTFTNGMRSVDHNLMIRNYHTPMGLYSYVFEANLSSGLRIYDISNLSNVVEVGWADSYPYNNGQDLLGAWGVYSQLPSGMILLSDMQAGLLVIDPSQAIVDQCSISNAPEAHPNPTARNRYLAFTPTNAGIQTAIRVRMTDLPGSFEAFEGSAKWVALPENLVDSINLETVIRRSRLSCDPVYHDWGSVGPLMISDHEIIPGGVYDIQQIGDRCDAGREELFSAALSIGTTGTWGDLIGESTAEPPNGIPNFFDFSGIVDKFQDAPGSPDLASADLQPSQPDSEVNLDDIATCIDAFRGNEYPFGGPVGCP